MEKYLFADGTNVIREVRSDEELQSFIQSATEPAKIRIWIFNSSEWISLAEFNRRKQPLPPQPGRNQPAPPPSPPKQPAGRSRFNAALRSTLTIVAAAAVIALIYNFTRVSWRQTSPLTLQAARPANTPPANVDSLIETIEMLRGQKLDRVTRTNFRIRNTWPELIQLQLTADRDTSREGLRFYHTTLTIDNATGYQIDQAVVRLMQWKDGVAYQTDTLVFSNIPYSTPASRLLAGRMTADSLTLSFASLRAKSFNFCYSIDKKSNYGNYNDRWYCR